MVNLCASVSGLSSCLWWSIEESDTADITENAHHPPAVVEVCPCRGTLLSSDHLYRYGTEQSSGSSAWPMGPHPLPLLAVIREKRFNETYLIVFHRVESSREIMKCEVSPELMNERVCMHAREKHFIN